MTAGRETATAAEIAQQPLVWRQLARALSDRREEWYRFLSPLLVQPDLRIVLAGAGTSAFAGRVLAAPLARRLGRRVDALATTDILSNPADAFADDSPTLLVSFARSGDSPESVAATELADACLSSVHHLIVTCNPGGRLATTHAGNRRSHVLLMPAAAHDTGFAMTSSFTSMLLTTWLALTASPEIVDVCERLAAATEPLIADPLPITRFAQRPRPYRRLVYLGSGPLAGIAQESALKALELTAGRVVAFHDSALGFRHGPKAVLDDRTLVVVYRSNDAYTARYDDDIAAELRALRSEDVLVVTTDPGTSAFSASMLVLPGLVGLEDVLLAVPYVVVAQLLALALSEANGLTPDNPFPDGSVNRVVQGVTVHRWTR